MTRFCIYENSSWDYVLTRLTVASVNPAEVLAVDNYHFVRVILTSEGRICIKT